LFRLVLMGLVCFYCIWAVSWEGTLFVSGLLLAQITLMFNSSTRTRAPRDEEAVELLESSAEMVSPEQQWRKSYLPFALFGFALYLAGTPDWNRK